MSWLRLTLLFIALVVVGGGIWYAFSTDPGYVLVSLRGYSIEMTLMVALGTLLVLGLLLWLLWILIASPFRKWRSHRLGLAQERLAAGLIALREGHTKEAGNLFQKAAKNERLRLASVVYGAQAALDRGDETQAKAIFDSIEGDHVGALKALNDAEVCLACEKPEEALTALDTQPNYDVPRKAELRFRALVDAQRWDDALALLPTVRQFGSLKPAAINRIESQLIEGSLGSADSVAAIRERFSRLGREQQANESFVLAAAQRSHALNDDAYAADLIKSANKKAWSGKLLDQYAALESLDTQDRLKYAEKYLNEHDSDAWLHLALGKLCAQASLWGKAESHLRKAERLGLKSQAQHALATTLQKQGRTTEALAAAMEALAQNAPTMSSTEALLLPKP